MTSLRPFTRIPIIREERQRIPLKNNIGKVTKLQEVAIRKIQMCGGIAVVVRSVDEVRAVMESI